MTGAATSKTRRGEKTRARILETALRLFLERGYEATTMRAIADEAGVALGNAYYYFRSKDHLIQAFYGRTHDEVLERARAIIARETTLEGRLGGVLAAKLDVNAPYHRFAGVLFKTAADPSSPLNPFSDDSTEVRDDAIALFAEMVDGIKAPADLKAELPWLLWVYHMGVILFWIHDRSPGCERSYRLATRTSEIVARLVGLASAPLMRPLRRATLRLLSEIRDV